MADRVLVTGISGFIGSRVALSLLQAGYRVRGSLRDPSRAAAVGAALAAAGADTDRLEFVTLDLLADAGWAPAAAGCRFLAHVASPFVLAAPRDPEVLIRPAVEGTRRALQAGLAAGVERVVVTSSVAAVTYGHPRERTEIFTASDWSETSGPDVTAYTESKTRAELEAWSLMEAAGRRQDLVAVNPSVVLGPLLDADPGTSGQLILRLMNGSVPALPRFHFGFIDVRDVAELHLKALLAPEAGGQRLLASAGTRSMREIASDLRAGFPERARRIPGLEIPDWLVRVYGRFDPSVAANIASLGRVHRLDCGPAEALLGRPFITPRLAAAAMATSLIAHGLL